MQGVKPVEISGSKKKEYLKEETNEHEANCKNKNVRDMYTDI